MALELPARLGKASDEKFSMYYSILLANARKYTGDPLATYLSTATGYMNGERIADSKLKEMSAEANGWIEDLRKDPASSLVKSGPAYGLFRGIKAALELFDEIDARQREKIPFSPSLRKEILDKDEIPHLSIVPR